MDRERKDYPSNDRLVLFAQETLNCFFCGSVLLAIDFYQVLHRLVQSFGSSLPAQQDLMAMNQSK